jgi:hypothetical protein
MILVTGFAPYREEYNASQELAICGTSVFWRLEKRPHKIGIAVGCFTDPTFPPPERVYHLSGKFGWVTFPEDSD